MTTLPVDLLALALEASVHPVVVLTKADLADDAEHYAKLARGVGAIDLRVIGNIVISWVVTLPVGGVLAALFFFTLKGIFT